jgi:hypothetical protein
MSKSGNEFQAFEYHQGFRKRGTGTRAIPVAPYSPREVGTMLGFSAATIRGMIANDPAVHRLTGPAGKITYKIPEDVVSRLRARLMRDTLKPKIAARVPKVVVILRDPRRRVA